MKIIAKHQIFKIENKSDLISSFSEKSYLSDIFDFLHEWFDDSAFIEVKTSGSTGIPKTIRLAKQTMLNSARMTDAYFGLNSESLALLCLPASYIAGKMMIVRAIAGDFSLIAVEPSANPFAKLKDFMVLDSIDFAAITPYQLLHSAEDIPQSGVRQIIVGGSPVTAAMEELTADWPVALYETFGMTETASHIALRRFNGDDSSDFFKAMEGVELSLDERGCLQIFAPHLHSEMLVTNDLVELKSDNQFRWLGRADRVINSGGIKVFPEQIEKVMQSVIPGNFFVSGVADEVLGQKVVLFIEDSTNPVTSLHPRTQDIMSQLKSLLNPYTIPKQIYTLPAFVYSSGNKILRNETVSLVLNSVPDVKT